MKLELRSIISPGNIEKERLTLRALADVDLGDYLVAQSGYIEDSPTLTFYHTMWFPFKPISKGDLVVIYTKEGNSRERELGNGRLAHFFYLDLEESIWDNPHRGAVVLQAPNWHSKSAIELER